MAEYHDGPCCDCIGELDAEYIACGVELNAMENDLDDARDEIASLVAALRDLGPEPTPMYADVMLACAAGAVRLGVDPTPWGGYWRYCVTCGMDVALTPQDPHVGHALFGPVSHLAIDGLGPIACGALGPPC